MTMFIIELYYYLISMTFIPKSDFEKVLSSVPLVSVDLCLYFEGQILLGHRKNEPAKNFWFTPGGRIMKNEGLQIALSRIAKTELNLDLNYESASLMGVWDHFYDNSVVSDSTSTHYVNLPHFIKLSSKLNPQNDYQHSSFRWWNLSDALESPKVHKYVKPYLNWVHEKEKTCT